MSEKTERTSLPPHTSRQKEIRIPFSRPSLAGNELPYVAEAIRRGQASGNGEFGRNCELILEEILGVTRVLLTTSCTHALEMASLLLDIGPNDEVILPSFTFVSTANAFALHGARPVFVDIRLDTLNMDESLVEGLITSRTKAIVPVHYGGVGCELDILSEIATRRGVSIIEDNAHGLFGKYQGRYLGSFGRLATQSFHETKNLSCGEGGALIVNDRRLMERADTIRDKGTNRKKFLLGEVDKYTWVDLGSSYVLSDILAAFLLGQLEARTKIQDTRHRIWQFYYDNLESWADRRGVRLPYVPPHCDQSYHLFYLLLPSAEHRAGLIAHLRERGVLAVFHYQPLHLSPMGLEWGYREGNLPITERVSNCILRLPFYNDLRPEQQEFIVEALLDWQP